MDISSEKTVLWRNDKKIQEEYGHMLEIEIPILWKVSANEVYAGVHWSKRNALAKDYHQLVNLKTKGLIFEPLTYPVQLFFNFHWASRALDSSNCSYLVKLIEDGLKGEILPDDSIKYVQTIITTSQKQTDKTKKQDFVYITILSATKTASLYTWLLRLR